MSAVTTPGSGPRVMSSKLLTMKFMQRGAAASPTTPSPATPDEPAPKRRKKGDDSFSSPRVKFDEVTNARTLQEAEECEEAKRQAALERQGIAAGDTRWSFSFANEDDDAQVHVLKIVSTGYASLDRLRIKSESEESSLEEQVVMVGRRSYGNFNKVLEKEENGEDDASSSDSDNDSDESDASERDSDDPTAQLIRTSREQATKQAKVERKAKRKAEETQAQELAKKRKKKDVKLNPSSTSISGRMISVACHRCGGPHYIKDCSQPAQHGERFSKRAYGEGQGGSFSKKPKTSK